jgi:hypothetical protein
MAKIVLQSCGHTVLQSRVNEKLEQLGRVLCILHRGRIFVSIFIT